MASPAESFLPLTSLMTGFILSDRDPPEEPRLPDRPTVFLTGESLHQQTRLRLNYTLTYTFSVDPQNVFFVEAIQRANSHSPVHFLDNFLVCGHYGSCLMIKLQDTKNVNDLNTKSVTANTCQQAELEI